MSADAPVVLVSVGAVKPDDNNSKFKDGDTQAVWADYMVINKYFKDRKKYVLGVTSPDGFKQDNTTVTSAVVQLASPVLIWVCDWTASRAKVLPKIPDPKPVDSKWVLLDDGYEEPNVTLAKDGVTPIYRISGTYVYACLRPDEETILSTNFPRCPWMEDFLDRKLTAEVFEGSISDPGGYTLST